MAFAYAEPRSNKSRHDYLWPQESSATDPLSPKGSGRIDSIDLLRGIVMVIMMLDHTRDFIHSGGLLFDPTDLTKTTPALFFTRWITHFCAPVFVFLAGTGAYLQLARGRSKRDLSKFLLTRGARAYGCPSGGLL
jgi:uncharacterized membrane protein